MEAYRHAHGAHNRTSHLTKLYDDTKKSALTSINAHSTATEQFPALHLKFKIQKDRLITWGLEWSDAEKGSDGNIDDAVAKAGLTETVDSVMRNIKEVTEEAERIHQASLPTHIIGHTGDKLTTSTKPVKFDQARYEDLLRDLTTSIDTLYDLTKSRRALARGDHPSFTSTSTEFSARDAGKPASFRKGLGATASFADSDVTLVNTSFQRPTLSPYAGSPPSIEPSALRLPYEGPPPYESLGVPSTARFVAQLVRSRVPYLVQQALGSSAAEVPVLVEYANFSSMYRETHVPPPLQRLEVLSSYFQPMRPESQTNLSLLGYFEDPKQPRIGLVYDVPYSIQNRLQGNIERAAETLAPASLLKLLQKASKTQAAQSGDIVIPALEDRFHLAYHLVEQLQDLHNHEIPHGNINSGSVIFTMTASDAPLRQNILRSPLWSSFDLFSKCSPEGAQSAANLNIYRHPNEKSRASDQNILLDVQYDLYGMALVLLEIGLWTPIGDLYKPKYTLADFKLRLEKLWIPKLAARCGSVYMRVVQTCFSVADGVDVSELTPNGTYDYLLSKLRRCCDLDEEGAAPVPMIASRGSSEYAAFSDTGSELRTTSTQSFDRKSLPRQQSEPNQLHHFDSFSSPTDGMLYRQSTMPNFGSTPVPMAHHVMSPHEVSQASRQPSLRSQPSFHESLYQVKERKSRVFSTTPSFKDYKRKVTLIQQRWRACFARRQELKTAALNRALAGQTEAFRGYNKELVKSSEGRVKPKRRDFGQSNVPAHLIQEWANNYAFQLNKLCERALVGSKESSCILLTMYGESEETARPTFLIECERSMAKVRHVLKRHFKYDPTLFDVRVKKICEPIRRSRRSNRHGPSAAKRSMAPSGGLDKAVNPDYQEKPICGASIGAYRDEEHLPPVSFGGIVVVDGTAYGMSVHHMLEPDDLSDEEDDAEAGAADDDSDTSSIRSLDNVSVYSHSDDDSTVRPPSTVPDDGEEQSHEGDVSGITPDDYEEIAVTQPALDDAIDCDLHVDVEDDEDDDDSGIDEDHLLSYKLGQVHASSGLKRTATSGQDGFKSISQSLPQEIDWALFELVPPRVHPYNVVRGGTKYCAIGNSSGDSFPVAVRESSQLACAKVHCIGRTSGLAGGVVSSTMELVKIHGRSTFSASWTVDGDFGAGGDSGAWVISNDDGKVCGHVLASKSGRTYICPMDLLLNDIKQTLAANSVTLPVVAQARSRSSPERTGASVSDAMGMMRLSDNEIGGVALPASPARRSMSRTKGLMGAEVVAVK